MTDPYGSVGQSIKTLDRPDEVQVYPNGRAETVRLGEFVVGRIVCEPGWHWGEQIKPLVGGESCQFRHVGISLGGELRFRLNDGTEFSVVTGDVFDVPAGHDVWVVGDEPAVSVMWVGWRGFGRPPVVNRVVKTLVFTDIVESTRRLVRIGDGAWDRLLDNHDISVREVLDEYHGMEIDTTGDGFLIAFDGVRMALSATLAIRQTLSRHGLRIRASVHTGEVELVPGGLRGRAVHEAARIIDLAEPGEILVSDTARELATGYDGRLVDRGHHLLAGIPGERHVFALVEADEA